MLVECQSNGHFVGWVEVPGPANGSGSTAVAMYSYSAEASEAQPHLLECCSLSLDPELMRIFEPIREEAFFVEKLRGLKEPRVLARDLQSFVNELCSTNYSAHKAASSGNKDNSTRATHNQNTSNISSLTARSSGVQTYLHASEWGFSSVQLAHIAAIGWRHVESTNTDMSRLTLSVTDSRHRKHVFEVRFDTSAGGYPWTPPEVTAELPVAVSLASWPTQSTDGGNLKLVLAAVTEEAERHVDLLDILQDLDTHTCVLEPRRPSFAVTTRRIALEKSCSIYLDFPDPMRNPYAMCSIRFLGPPGKLVQYQNSLQANAHMWRTHTHGTNGGAYADSNDDVRSVTPTPLTHAMPVSRGALVRENIQEILGLTLPAPRLSVGVAPCDRVLFKRSRIDNSHAVAATTGASSSTTDMDVVNEVVEYVTECGICYSFNGGSGDTDVDADADARMPDQVCPNSNCGKMFHKHCLVEWLHAVPSSRSSFGTIFGSCPYCYERLSVNSLLL